MIQKSGQKVPFYIWNDQMFEALVKDNKNKICKHAEIDRHLEFVTADFYMWEMHQPEQAREDTGWFILGSSRISTA